MVKLFGNCAEQLTVDVSRFDDFSDLASDISSPVCRDADDAAVDALPYDAGGRRDIVRVRVCFLYKSINPSLGMRLEQSDGGERKMISLAIFRNEPFED